MGTTQDWVSSRALWETLSEVKLDFTHQNLLSELDTYYKNILGMCTCHFHDFDRTFNGGSKIYRIKKTHLKRFLTDNYDWLLGVWF